MTAATHMFMSSISHSTQPKVYNKLCAKIQKSKWSMSFVWNIRETFLGVDTINVWELNEKRGGKKNGIKWLRAPLKSLVSPQQASHNTRRNKYYNRFPVAVFFFFLNYYSASQRTICNKRGIKLGPWTFAMTVPPRPNTIHTHTPRIKKLDFVKHAEIKWKIIKWIHLLFFYFIYLNI